MNWLLRSFVPAVALIVAMAGTAYGRYVALVSTANPAAPILTVLDENLQPIGSVGVPSGVKQVLLSDEGNKIIVVAENALAPVSFVSIVSGGLSQVRTSSLGSGTPVQAMLSAGGSLLYVVTRDPGVVYAMQVAGEQVTGAPIPVQGTPIEAELTNDGQFLLVLSSPNFLQPIQTENWQALPVVLINATFADPRLSLSVAPFGSVFVTGLNHLIEFRALPPFDEISRNSLAGGNLVHPGKLHFMPPAGIRAYTVNRTQAGHSVGSFDFSLRSASSPAGSYVGGAVVTGTSGSPFGSQPELVSDLIVTRDLRAIGLAPALQQVFEFNYAPGSGVGISEFRVNQVPLTNIAGLAASGEFPNRLNLYYINSGGTVFRFPLAGIGNIPAANLQRGQLWWLGAPSTGAAGSIYGYGADRANVAPGSTIRYYLRVIDAAGRPSKGRTVAFQALTPGMRLLQDSAQTNRDGWAYVDVVAPDAAGAFSVQATSGNVPPIVLSSTVAAASGGSGGGGASPQARLLKISGDGQLTPFGGTSFPLVVQAVDAQGKPIAGKQILWQTTTSNLQFISNPQTATDSEGIAQVTFYYLGNIPPGESFVHATVEAVSDLGSATFNVIQFPGDTFGVPSLQMLIPEPSNKEVYAKLGQPKPEAIKFRIVSGGGPGRPNGVPIPNVGLRIVGENSDPAAGPVASCQEGVALSDRNGIVNCTLIGRGKIGVTFLTANVGGSWSFGGIRLILEPGDPVPPLIISGNNQTGRTGTTLPRVLVAQIVDAGGNPLPGTQVVWSVSNPNALTLFDTVSTANSAGEVTTRVRLGNIAGTFQVAVRAGDLSATFAVTVESTATALQKVSGDNQTGVPINTAFPAPLVVRVVDAQNMPLSGVPVSWSISGPGTLSAASTPTGANGQAQVNVTAGGTPGSIVVTAAVSGLSPVSFTLATVIPGPSITAASFRNYATGAQGTVSPGLLVLLTGSGIAKNVPNLAVASIFTGRLPIELRGLVVEFRSGGASSFAPIYWIAREGQTESALIQVPYEIAGPNVEARVSVDGIVTSVTLPVATLSPGIIEDTIDGRRAAVIIRSDGLVVTRATPARRGETVRMYAIGLGQATPLAETNRVGRPDQKVNATVAVGIDGAGVEVVEAKLAENLFGIYEIFFKIPDNAQLGDRPLGLQAAPPGGQSVFAQPSVLPVGLAQ